jgi:hypothetical protein
MAQIETFSDGTPNGEAYLEASSRFFTAASSGPPTDEQRISSGEVRAATIRLAAHINARVPNGRDKSIALTALEDVLMRANRGIFATGPTA